MDYCFDDKLGLENANAWLDLWFPILFLANRHTVYENHPEMSQARKVLFAFKKVRLGVKVSCWMRETLAKANGFILRLLHNFQTVWTSIFVLLMPFLACSFGALGLLWIWHDVFEVDRIFVDDEAGLSGPISNAIMGFFSSLIFFWHSFILCTFSFFYRHAVSICKA